MKSLFASIDIGTNSAILLIAENIDGMLHAVEQKIATPRLGRNLGITGLISEESFAQLVLALDEFLKAIAARGAKLVGVAATEAFRKAKNGMALLEKISLQLDLPAEIISGEKEAALGLLAVSNRYPGKKIAVADIGGGSTEFLGQSYPIGAVQLSEKKLSLEKMRENVRLTFAKAEENEIDNEENVKIQNNKTKENFDWVMVGGTASALAMLKLKLEEFNSEAMEGFSCTKQEVVDTIEFLFPLSLEKKLALPGMDKGRADILVPGFCILEGLLEKVGADSFIVSDRGLRYGLILDGIK